MSIPTELTNNAISRAEDLFEGLFSQDSDSDCHCPVDRTVTVTVTALFWPNIWWKIHSLEIHTLVYSTLLLLGFQLFLSFAFQIQRLILVGPARFPLVAAVEFWLRCPPRVEAIRDTFAHRVGRWARGLRLAGMQAFFTPLTDHMILLTENCFPKINSMISFGSTSVKIMKHTYEPEQILQNIWTLYHTWCRVNHLARICVKCMSQFSLFVFLTAVTHDLHPHRLSERWLLTITTTICMRRQLQWLTKWQQRMLLPIKVAGIKDPIQSHTLIIWPMHTREEGKIFFSTF